MYIWLFDDNVIFDKNFTYKLEDYIIIYLLLIISGML